MISAGVPGPGQQVALFERACILVVPHHLDWPGKQKVGTRVDFGHIAATPIERRSSTR